MMQTMGFQVEHVQITLADDTKVTSSNSLDRQSDHSESVQHIMNDTVMSTTGPSHEKPASGRGWFEVRSVLIGFFLGGVFVNSASNILRIRETGQVLQLTNSGTTPVKIDHDAAAFWNSGELTIAPGQTMTYSFIDGDTMTAYAESGAQAAGRVVMLKRSVRTADTRIDPSGQVVFEFTDQ